MSGTLLAAAAGVGFGVFQTLNRRAVGGMSDAYLATFLQLLVALAVLVFATLTTTDFGLLAEATAALAHCGSSARLAFDDLLASPHRDVRLAAMNAFSYAFPAERESMIAAAITEPICPPVFAPIACMRR